MLIVLILTVLMVAGLLLTVVGMRGRVTDDHPLCRRCGFDLTGKSPTTTRCVECGADISLLNSVRIGHRVRRIGLLLPGLLLTLSAILIQATGLVAILRMHDWRPWLPLGYVIDEVDAKATSATDRTAALAELSRRVRSKALSETQIRRLFTHVLDVQADASKTWAGWDDLFTTLLASGYHPTDSQYERYIRQAVNVSLAVKPKLRRGRSVSFEYDIVWGRYVKSIWLDGSFRAPLRVDGREILSSFESETFRRNPDGSMPGSNYFIGVTLDRPEMLAIPNGARTFNAPTMLNISVVAPMTAGPFQIEVPATAAFEMFDRDAVVDKFEVDADARDAMAAAFTVARVATDKDGKVDLRVLVKTLSHPISVEAVLVGLGGEEQRVGNLMVEAGKPPAWHRIYTTQRPRFADGVTVNVVLRPSQDGADHTRQLVTYWGEPLIVRGVRVGAPYAVPFVHDESLRAAVEKSLTLLPLSLAPGERSIISVNIDFHGAPVKLAYTAVLRANDQEIILGPIMGPAGSNFGFGLTAVVPTNFPANGKVDLILRPDPDWESQSMDLTPPWAGEIIRLALPVHVYKAPD